jgi:hypothetical protein
MGNRRLARLQRFLPNLRHHGERRGVERLQKFDRQRRALGGLLTEFSVLVTFFQEDRLYQDCGCCFVFCHHLVLSLIPLRDEFTTSRAGTSGLGATLGTV